jgi:hypothetical protein
MQAVFEKKIIFSQCRVHSAAELLLFFAWGGDPQTEKTVSSRLGTEHP